MVHVLAMRTVSHIAIAQMCIVPERPPLFLRNPSMTFSKVFDHLCAAQSIFAKLFCMHLVGACHYVFPSNVDSMLPTVVQSLVKPKVMMLTSFSCLSGNCLWQCLGDVHSADLLHPSGYNHMQRQTRICQMLASLNQSFDLDLTCHHADGP